MRPSTLLIPCFLFSVSVAGESPVFTPTQRNHWAWKAPVRKAPPRVRAPRWVRTLPDSYVLDRLERAGIPVAPPASAAALLRRVTFDLTGLPPTLEEQRAYLRDPTDTEYARVVDRLLASPAFGERWARHWLDVARYADSNGYEFDEVRPDMWRYRDYVVRSMNADKPFDRFVLEQLAGDELAPGGTDERIATGFNLLGPDMTDAADQAARRQNTLNDMTDTAGLAFLGLTLACARCHDHKYEPLTQRDYYRFQAYFSGSEFRKDLPLAMPSELQAFTAQTKAFERRRADLVRLSQAAAGDARVRLREQKIAELPDDLQTAFNTPEDRRTAEQELLVRRNEAKVEPDSAEVARRLPSSERGRYLELQQQLRDLAKERPRPLPSAMGLASAPKPAETYVLNRGEISQKGERVSSGTPEILGRPDAPPGSRLALARWMVSDENPLTARVHVNRVWQHLFGRGLVETPSDFGVRGQNPTHPELLDALAIQFREQGWSVKRLIRTLVLSSTYRQSSIGAPEAGSKDPDNQLLSRQNRRRLEAEAIRDSLLAVSGRLDPTPGGPGVFPALPEGAGIRAAVWPTSPRPEDSRRRTLYTFVRRNLSTPGLDAFDLPDTNLSCARRESTTTAPQSLALMNGADSHAAADAMEKLIRAAGDPFGPQVVVEAFQRSLGRRPGTAELNASVAFLREQAAFHRARREAGEISEGEAIRAARRDFCLALLNTNEFLFVN